MNQSIQFIKPWLYRSLLFAVMLCFSSLSYAQVDVPKLVDGYYELKTPAHLKLFSSSVNAGLQTINARLVADIDMSAEGEFVPIGTYGKGYRGYFDGN